MRFHIHTLGCKVNRAESETIAAALIHTGLEQSPVVANADVVIVNTCTVTGEADAKNRKIIRSLLRQCKAPILVTGCAVNVDADHYADMDERVVCESDKAKVPELVQSLISVGEGSLSMGGGDLPVGENTFPVGADILPARSITEDILTIRASHANFRTRVDLKIQDGCDNSCSYCIVHTARGPARSVPANEVLEQTRTLVQNGVRELVLVGIDLAAYKDGNSDLSSLVSMLQEQTGIDRIRISSVEPQSVTSSLIHALGKSTGRLCRHLHLCLQSGSSKVLAEMNRHYCAGEFLTLVMRMREASPALALSTDVIVGFPGETDEDFEQTCELVRQCAFMRLHVFRYSKRPGTPAAERADQIDPSVMNERSKTLQRIGRELALEDMQRRLGTREQVIIERPGLGTSESFHTVACDTSLAVGSLVELEFTDIDEKQMRIVGM